MAELLSSKVVVVEAAPSIRSLPTIPTGIAGFMGVSKRGPLGTPTLVTSFDEYVDVFGTFDINADMTLAVEHFFRNGGRSCFCLRIVHYTDLTDPDTFIAVKGSIDIDDRGSLATPAIVTSTTGPWFMTAGDHIDLDFDNNGSQVATIAATPAGEESGSAETYDFTGGGQTLTLKIDQGVVQTVTFQLGDFASPSAATAEEVAAAINAGIVGGQAVVTATGTKVTIYSDTLGTGSYVEITGGTANSGILDFPTSEVQGTGNVADVTSVSPTEIAAMITALPPANSGTAVVSGSTVVLTSGDTGAAAEIEVEVASVQTTTIFATGVTNGSDAGTQPTLRIAGKTEGDYADNISAEIALATSGETDEFNLVIKESGALKETFPNLSMTDTDDNYVENIVNDTETGSNLVAATDLDSGATPPADLPAIGSYTLTGGDDGLTGIADTDWTGNVAGPTGFYCFDNIQDVAIGPIAPNRCTSAVQNGQVEYAAARASMFPPLGPPAGNSKQQIVTYVATTASLEGKSEFGAIFWPRVKIVNPATAIYGTVSELTVDPVGMIAGVFARTDGALPGGVYRAPAGLEYGELRGVIGFETDDVLNEATRDYIATHRINPLTTFAGAPNFIDGHDTLKGNGNFPTIPERRGVIYIEQSLSRGLEVFRHAPNDRRTRQEVSQTITAFLLAQMRLRAFRSMNPAEAFLVDVSDEINPPSEEFIGKLNANISLATNKPNKWIVLTFSQDVRAIQEEIANAQQG